MWDWFRPEDISTEMFAGALDETVPRHQDVLEFVDPEPEDNEVIRQEVIVQQADRQASIVGELDAYPRVKDRKATARLVEPFDMKNKRPYNIKHDGIRRGGPSGVQMADALMAEGVDYLEGLRQKTMVNAVLAMCSDRLFSYQNGDIVIHIPYDDVIGELDTPSVDWDNTGSVDPYQEQDAFITEFFQLVDQVPLVGWVSSKTAATMKQIQAIRDTYQAQAPRDPQPESPEDGTFSEFMFDGFTWRVFRRKRLNTSGNLVDAIPEGVALITVPTVAEDGRPPIRWHRAANDMNDENNNSPYYFAETESVEDPHPAASVGFYDNGIPGVAKKNIVMKYQMYTP